MFFVVVIIMLISVVLALWCLEQQDKLEEIAKAKKKLSRSRVIFHKDSSDFLES